MLNRFNSQRGLLIKVTGVVLITMLASLLLRPLVISAGKDKLPPKDTAAKQTQSTFSPSELTNRIDKLIEDGEKDGARWGVFVLSMADGSTLYQRNGQRLFTPASNMKIYTTSVALELLGADYHWRTSVYANTQPDSGGRISGDLVLYGRGAPDLVSDSKDPDRGSLAKLADALYARGVRSIGGNVIGDESYFRGDPLGDGWQWTDLQWYFGAEASALSVNENEIDVNFVPSAGKREVSEVRTSDPEGYVTVHNQMMAAKGNDRLKLGIHRGLSDNEVEVWGEFPSGSKGFGARLSVHRPALWAAKLFTRALKSKGIRVEGQTDSRNSRVAPGQRFDPSRGIELAAVTSKSLREIAKRTNKESNNLYAELILRTLGRERGELAPAAEGLGRERGDEEAGLAVIRLWLARNGVPSAHLALHDGSGLSRLNLVTPEASARLMFAVSKLPNAQIFLESLPIAGRDGTLGGRLKTVVDRVHAKTGSLTYDNSLSGYLTAADGRQLAFSIMCNDQTTSAESTVTIDQIVTLLASSPGLPAEKARK